MTLISTACSWVNMFGGHKAAIFTQVGQFYFGRWVSFSSAVTAPLVYQGQHVVNRIRIHARTENSRQPGHGYLIDHWQSKTTGQ